MHRPGGHLLLRMPIRYSILFPCLSTMIYIFTKPAASHTCILCMFARNAPRINDDDHYSHAGFTGRNCESELERCDDELCSSRGMCWMIPVMDGSKKQKPVCYCQPDYYGKNCGKKYNECLLPSAAKCLNGGRCVDQVDGYSCSCPHQWFVD